MIEWNEQVFCYLRLSYTKENCYALLIPISNYQMCSGTTVCVSAFIVLCFCIYAFQLLRFCNFSVVFLLKKLCFWFLRCSVFGFFSAFMHCNVLAFRRRREATADGGEKLRLRVGSSLVRRSEGTRSVFVLFFCFIWFIFLRKKDVPHGTIWLTMSCDIARHYGT